MAADQAVPEQAGRRAVVAVAGDIEAPANAQRRRVVGSAALLVVAVVALVALLGSGVVQQGDRPAELEQAFHRVKENVSKQSQFHRVFDMLEKKPSAGDVAKAARARKHAIAEMSPSKARSILMKWGFMPPSQGGGGKQTLHEVRSQDRRAGRDEGASRKELARLNVEASDDDLRQHRADRTDEKDMEADSRDVKNDREIANRAKSERERRQDRERSERSAPDHESSTGRHDEDRHDEARRSGFGHLESVAISLAKAVQNDQEGIVHEHQKLTQDRNKLLQTRELIDKALSHLAEKASGTDRDRDDGDFTIKVRSDVQRQQQYERPRQSKSDERNDYWKIPIRPHDDEVARQESDESRWTKIRRRRAPDSRANEVSPAFTDHAPVDPLALEEAASADGLQNVPASMASQLIGQQAPSLESTADNYMKNVFGAQGGSLADMSEAKLRSAQPVLVQQERKVQRMVDAMKGDVSNSASLVSTFGANYAAGIGGQPYAAETPANTRFGETAAQSRRDGSYLSDVFQRK